MIGFRRSIRFKLYALAVPITLLSATFVTAALLPYRQTERGLHDARDDIRAAIAAQGVARATSAMTWHMAMTVAGAPGSAERMRAAARAGERSLARSATSGGGSVAELLDALRTVRRMSDDVVEAVERGDLAVARASFYDEILPFIEERVQMPVADQARSARAHLRLELASLASLAGRVEFFFGGRLTTRLLDATNNVEQQIAGAGFYESLISEGLELLEPLVEGDDDWDAVYSDRESAQEQLGHWMQIDTGWAGAPRDAAVPSHAADLVSLRSVHERVAQVEDETLERFADGDVRGSLSNLRKSYGPIFAEAVDRTEALISDAEERLDVIAAGISGDAIRIYGAIIVVALLAFLLGVGFVVILARRLSVRIRRVTSAARRIGDGDLTAQVPVEAHDELSDLAVSFNAMVAELSTEQARVSTLLDSMPVLLFTATYPGLVPIYVSPNSSATVSYGPEHFDSQESWASKIHPDDLPALVESCLGLAPDDRLACDLRWLYADGTYGWVDVRIRRIIVADGSDFVVGTITDISERLKREDEIRFASERIQRLLAGTVEATERERTELAADLHDGPIQRLTALLLRLESVKRRLDRADVDAARAVLGAVQPELAAEISCLRQLMSDLRPPALDERGLAPALSDHVQGFAKRERVRAAIDVQIDGRLSASLETTIYRVLQEALTNVAKHASSTTVSVSACVEGRDVVLIVRDDGVGFDVRELANDDRTHFGIVGMEERTRMAGGDLHVDSTPGIGTTVTARFPFGEIARAA